MKKIHLFLTTALFLVTLLSVKAQYGYGGSSMGGSVRPMVAINSGDIAGLKGVTSVNIIYDYSKMGVGSYRNEQDYINKKVEEYNKKDPQKAEKFKQSWVNSRKDRFEPKFEEMFNKMGLKSGIVGKNYANDAPVTLKVETVFTEPGYHIGISKMPSYIDLECTFLDKNGKEIVRYFIKNAVGSQAMGFDFDAGSRLVESYAKAAKMLMKDVNKKLKKLK